MKPVFVISLAVIFALSPAAPLAAGEDGPYDPTPEAPFGKPNPEAAPELSQFAFMIGEFDCVDRLLREGKWIELPATWHGSYFLNGRGIIDRYWNGRFATSNTRVFDPSRGKWFVTFFKMPGYNSGVWQGEQRDGDMVMEQAFKSREGKEGVNRLTFYDITEASYEWKSELVFDGKVTSSSWTSSCKRRVKEQ